MAETAAVSCNLMEGGHAHGLPDSETHVRLARALPYYTTPEERELAIQNLKWMSVLAPTHSMQMDCRMLLLAMRNVQSFGPVLREQS